MNSCLKYKTNYLESITFFNSVFGAILRQMGFVLEIVLNKKWKKEE